MQQHEINTDPDLLEEMHGKNYLIIIGIERYAYLDSMVQTKNETEEFCDILTKKYIFDRENIIKLYNEQATKKNIYSTVKDLQSKVIPDTDNLLLFYAGHSYSEESNETCFWLPYDAKPNDENSYIEQSDFINGCFKPLKTKHTLLITDSCFSSYLFIKGSVGEEEWEEREDDSIISRWVFASGRQTYPKTTRKGQYAGNPFINTINEMLKANDTAHLSLLSMVNQVIDQMHSNDYRIPEIYPIFNCGHKTGQFIFHRRYDEDIDWKQAKNADTIKNYELFLIRHPKSKHGNEAEERIIYLNEEIRWKNVKDEKSLWAYQHYLKNYPNGHFVGQAQKGIADIHENNRWQKTLAQNSITAFYNYINSYPDGKYTKEAMRSIQNLKQQKETRQNNQYQKENAKTNEVSNTENNETQKKDSDWLKKADLYYSKNKLKHAEKCYKQALKSNTNHNDYIHGQLKKINNIRKTQKIIIASAIISILAAAVLIFILLQE